MGKIKNLDSGRYLDRRLISEMLNIKIQINSMNLLSDIEFLHHGYVNILSNVSKYDKKLTVPLMLNNYQ